MKVALIDSPRLTDWKGVGHRLRALETQFGSDIETVLISVADEGALPILAGWGWEADVRPLIDSLRVFEAVKREQPDFCIVPFRGGLAHGILMGRACGELPAGLRVALIAEEPTRSLILRSDLTAARLHPLVCDAMERFCLAHADALLSNEYDYIDELRKLTPEKFPKELRDVYASPEQGLLLRSGGVPESLCFVGSFTRAANVVTFIEAAERLAATRPETFGRVHFIGPMPDVALAPGREWLGRRAASWRFRFKVVETDRFEDAIAKALETQALVYVPRFPTACRMLAERKDLVWVELSPAIERDPIRLEGAIIDLLEGAAPQPDRRADLSTPLMQSIEVKRGAKPSSNPVSLSICILHKDRPAFLNEALASVRRQIDPTTGDRIELIVYDNGSVVPDSIRSLAELTRDPLLKVVRNETPSPVPTAMNAMAACATGSFLAFLDDDNLMAEGGLAALLRACAADAFDVITGNLLVVDADRMAAGPVAKTAFIGPAQTAGLFFNGFGDTSMIFRRDSFEQIGGFHDTGGPMPGADWLLLARAQAEGLRIGVLQEPAFLYRRDVGRADRSWQKYDQHGVRGLMLQHYGDAYDGALLAKLSQALAVDLL